MVKVQYVIADNTIYRQTLIRNGLSSMFLKKVHTFYLMLNVT